MFTEDKCKDCEYYGIDPFDEYNTICYLTETDARANNPACNHARLRRKEKKMTGNEYQKLAARTINKDLYDKDIEYHALHGVVGEIGEIHSLYQKMYQGHDYDDVHMMKEFGDLLWFIAEYCTVMNWDLDVIMQMNIDKLKSRYPEGFDSEHSIHRTKDDI